MGKTSFSSYEKEINKFETCENSINSSESCLFRLFWTVKYESLILLSFVLIFIFIMRYFLFFWLLFLCVYVHSWWSRPDSHRLRDNCTETHTFVSLCHRIIYLVFLITFIHFWELILAEKSLEFSLIWTVWFLWRTTLIWVEINRILDVFRHLMILDLKILFAVVCIFINVLNGSFLLEIGMDNAIILIKFFFLFLCFKFLDSFDKLLIKRHIEIWL